MSYPTRFTVACSDPRQCWARECLWVGEDKGSYTPGRGYTSYHDKPHPVCTKRHLHGCPFPQPEPDPENARCCYRPTFKNVRRDRKAIPCETCGVTAPGWAAKVLRDLPTLPGVPCRHEGQTTTIIIGWRECPDCRGFWADRNGVEPLEAPTHTFDEMLDEATRRFKGFNGEGAA